MGGSCLESIGKENKDEDAKWNGHEDLELQVFLSLIVEKFEMVWINFMSFCTWKKKKDVQNIILREYN